MEWVNDVVDMGIKFQGDPIINIPLRPEKDITDQVEIIGEPKLLTAGNVSAEFNGIEVE